MSPAEAMASTPPITTTTQRFDLPPSALSWLRPEDKSSIWMPPRMTNAEELAAWDTLEVWDALCGRLIRESMFGHVNGARAVAESVAGAAERLAIRLGVRF